VRDRLPWEKRTLIRKIPKPLRPHRNTIRQWLVLAGLVTVRISPAWFTVGCLLTVVGALFRLWAKGYLTQRTGLTTQGPYQVCRNPFYLGNLVVDMGVCAMVGRVEVAAPYLVLWFVFHHHKILGEEAGLAAAYGRAYEDYRRSVPRLLPRLWLLARLDGLAGKFSWLNKNIAQRIEIPRFLSALSLPPLFYACGMSWSHGLSALRLPHVWPLCMLCTFAWLQVLSRALRRPLRRGQKGLNDNAYTATARLAALTGFVLFAFLVGHVTSRGVADQAVHHVLGLMALTGAALLWPGRRDTRPRVALEMTVSLLAVLSSGQWWVLFLPLTYYTVLLGSRLAAALHEKHRRLAADGALG
jgi:protein-S-isoprenylcysteine O-methyltransferase Ste14